MRTPVTVKIKFKSPSLGDFIERYAVDVSQAGIFIRTPKPLSVGTALNFEFQLQDGSPLLSGSGTVVWVRDQSEKQSSSPGMGVRFDDLPPASQDVLTRVLDQKTRSAQFADTVASTPAEPEPEPEPEPPPLPEPEPEPEPPPEPEPEPRLEERRAAPPPKQEARRPARAAPDGKEDLGEILFTDEDSKQAVAEGATPLAPEPAKRRTPSSPTVVPTSAKPVTAAEERKSSPVGWVVIVLMMVLAGGWFWWKYYGPGKKGQGGKPTPADVGVAAVKPDLAPPPKATVALMVESSPKGAKIIIDGTDTGKVTPAEIDGLEAEAEVEIALDLPGRKLHKGKFTPKAGASAPYKAELIEPAARKIRLSSEPPGAMIYLDREKVGTTPHVLSKKLRPSQTYRVKFYLPGYEDFETKLRPAEITWTRDGEDEVFALSATLEKKAARGSARPRKKPRKKPATVDDTPDDGETTEPEPATAPEPPPDPGKPVPPPPAPEAPPPEKKGAIKKPTWTD